MILDVDVLPHQEDFIFSKSKHTGLIGGYGSGKSFAGVLKTILKKMEYPGIDVAYYLPTYGLIKDVAFPKFKEQLEVFNIPYKLNETDKEFTTPYGEIKLRSMDNPDTIVGYEVGYSLIDETDILPTSKMGIAFVKIIGRNRKPLPNGDVNSTDVVGTPEGFKWAYNFFVKNAKPNRILIKGKTADNPFLPDDYIPGLEESYTVEQLAAYLNGEFVNLTTGSVYKNYDRKKNRTDRIIQVGDVLHVGMDFNITKMNAVIHVQDSQFKYAVDEIVNAYDTTEVCALLKSKFAGYKIIIYPDAAGSARSTSGKSDHDIIKSFGFTIRAPKSNPAVKDRVNVVNTAFCNKDGLRSYLVNDEQCSNYSEALEKQTYKNSVPDKTEGYDHICFVGSTKITTIKGQVAIKDIVVGDYVLTSEGWKKVIRKLKNGIKKTSIYKMRLGTLFVYLQCTDNHLIKTTKGWTEISKLKAGMTIFHNNFIKENHSNSTKEKDILATEVTECIDGFMKKKQINLFQKGLMFTILITIPKTIGLKIWNSLKKPNIIKCTSKKECKIIPNGLKNSLKMVKMKQVNGTAHQKDLNGIQNTLLERDLDNLHLEKKNVKNVQKNLLQKFLIRCFVQKIANPIIEENQGLIMKKGNAPFAEINSRLINISKEKIAHVNAVESSEEMVYDLEVEDCHEYFANGILVHNCEAGGYFIYNSSAVKPIKYNLS